MGYFSEVKSYQIAAPFDTTFHHSSIKRTNVFTISSYFAIWAQRAGPDSFILGIPLEYVHFVVEFRRLAHRITPHKEEHP